MCQPFLATFFHFWQLFFIFGKKVANMAIFVYA
nr:MAG TPA: hypothetical protein [Caudoviricetes sp.]